MNERDPLHQPPSRKQNWFAQNPGATVVLGILGGLFVMGSIANAADDDKHSPVSPSGLEAHSQEAAADFEGRQGDSKLPPTGDEFVMPQTAGMDLQLAQDTLQSVSDNPLFYSESVDATGAGRGQWLDSGWQVCWSEPAAGEVVGQSDTPTFAVVRVSENCP
jgi:hypothetical protein